VGGAGPGDAGYVTTEELEGGSDSILDIAVYPIFYGAAQAVGFGGSMQLSLAGLYALKRDEGFRDRAYNDIAGHPTIGYGHKILAGERELLTRQISEAEAERLLAQDVGSAERAVNAAVRVPITQAMFDALVGWAYNVGNGAMRSSTLVRLLNAGDYAGAQAQFARWNKITQGGRLVASEGLSARRAREAELFASQGLTYTEEGFA
jgi:lysozyme